MGLYYVGEKRGADGHRHWKGRTKRERKIVAGQREERGEEVACGDGFNRV